MRDGERGGGSPRACTRAPSGSVACVGSGRDGVPPDSLLTGMTAAAAAAAAVAAPLLSAASRASCLHVAHWCLCFKCSHRALPPVPAILHSLHRSRRLPPCSRHRRLPHSGQMAQKPRFLPVREGGTRVWMMWDPPATPFVTLPGLTVRARLLKVAVAAELALVPMGGGGGGRKGAG